MNPGIPARVVIVDDHPIVRDGLARIVSREGDMQIAAACTTADEALRVLRHERVDLVIVDISLVGVSGLELLRQIKLRHARMPALVVSMHDEALYAERAFAAGARGYVMKHEATDLIVAAARKILSGGIYLSDRMQNLLFERVAGGSARPERTSLQHLTEREFEVLRLIGQGLGTTQIATQLGRSVKTIESHRARLKDKLALGSASELIKFAARWVESDSAGP